MLTIHKYDDKMQLENSCKETMLMSQIDTLKQRILMMPKDFTYREAKKLLESMGFQEKNQGKTSGSRVKFYREMDKRVISLHKPHPGDIMKQYSVKLLVDFLKDLGEL